MTCITAVRDGDDVWMAGDAAAARNTDGSLYVRSDPKVFCLGKCYSGSFRMGQLLRYRFDAPEIGESQSLMSYLVGPFIDSVRRCFADGGFMTTADGADVGGDFLIGTRGRLFSIESDFQVAEMFGDFAACGSGEYLALGAMHASDAAHPRDRALAGLMAANAFNAFVVPPFSVVFCTAGFVGAFDADGVEIVGASEGG